jgi:RHS repeat-associated protein
MIFLLFFLTLFFTGTVNEPDGNVPLHEKMETRTPDYSTEKGYFDNVRTEPVVTWVFEEGTFVPAAKLTEKEQYSIVTNYLGTPEAMYREDGETVWTCELNSYGKVRNWQGEVKTDCPFRYQGQYEDAETGLYYNRFRYYSPQEGMYLSQDPIRLEGGYNLNGYVLNPNSWVDVFGLCCHGNDASSTKSQHGYEIYDNQGNVIKTGVSSGRVRMDGKSSRAEKQVREWNKNTNDPNGPFTSKVVANVPSGQGARQKIYTWESQNANKHRKTLKYPYHTRP